jgi:hypothetical protein
VRLLEAVTGKEAVVRREVVIDLDVELVVVWPFDAWRVPAVFGSGYSCVRMLRATVSTRLLGIWFPGNGCPVVGS